MKAAYLNLRYTVPERREAFTNGLKRLGYKIDTNCQFCKLKHNDIYVTWNRIGNSDTIASHFESNGLKVLVAENAIWGNDFADERWYTIAKNQHNTSGNFNIGDKSRWDNLEIELLPFRDNKKVIILPQRGIGSAPTVMPINWVDTAYKKYGGYIRYHPGKNKIIPLDQDLENYGIAVTWGSGAAVKALMIGLKIYADMPNWIAHQDNTEKGRLKMFRRLSWAQWTLEEISNGFAFAWLLS